MPTISEDGQENHWVSLSALRGIWFMKRAGANAILCPRPPSSDDGTEHYRTLCLQMYRRDEFTVRSRAVGRIQRVNISHDNSSRNASWFLDKVLVEDLQEKKVYEFPCNKWLATDQEDGKLSRDLACSKDQPSPTKGWGHSLDWD